MITRSNILFLFFFLLGSAGYLYASDESEIIEILNAKLRPDHLTTVVAELKKAGILPEDFSPVYENLGEYGPHSRIAYVSDETRGPWDRHDGGRTLWWKVKLNGMSSKGSYAGSVHFFFNMVTGEVYEPVYSPRGDIAWFKPHEAHCLVENLEASTKISSWAFNDVDIYRSLEESGYLPKGYVRDGAPLVFPLFRAGVDPKSDFGSRQGDDPKNWEKVVEFGKVASQEVEAHYFRNIKSGEVSRVEFYESRAVPGKGNRKVLLTVRHGPTHALRKWIRTDISIDEVAEDSTGEGPDRGIGIIAKHKHKIEGVIQKINEARKALVFHPTAVHFPVPAYIPERVIAPPKKAPVPSAVMSRPTVTSSDKVFMLTEHQKTIADVLMRYWKIFKQLDAIVSTEKVCQDLDSRQRKAVLKMHGQLSLLLIFPFGNIGEIYEQSITENETEGAREYAEKFEEHLLNRFDSSKKPTSRVQILIKAQSHFDSEIAEKMARMYERYAQQVGWEVVREKSGIAEVCLVIKGKGASELFLLENGNHKFYIQIKGKQFEKICLVRGSVLEGEIKQDFGNPDKGSFIRTYFSTRNEVWDERYPGKRYEYQSFLDAKPQTLGELHQDLLAKDSAIRDIQKLEKEMESIFPASEKIMPKEEEEKKEGQKSDERNQTARTDRKDKKGSKKRKKAHHSATSVPPQNVTEKDIGEKVETLTHPESGVREAAIVLPPPFEDEGNVKEMNQEAVPAEDRVKEIEFLFLALENAKDQTQTKEIFEKISSLLESLDPALREEHLLRQMSFLKTANGKFLLAHIQGTPLRTLSSGAHFGVALFIQQTLQALFGLDRKPMDKFMNEMPSALIDYFLFVGGAALGSLGYDLSVELPFKFYKRLVYRKLVLSAPEARAKVLESFGKSHLNAIRNYNIYSPLLKRQAAFIAAISFMEWWHTGEVDGKRVAISWLSFTLAGAVVEAGADFLIVKIAGQAWKLKNLSGPWGWVATAVELGVTLLLAHEMEEGIQNMMETTKRNFALQEKSVHLYDIALDENHASSEIISYFNNEYHAEFKAFRDFKLRDLYVANLTYLKEFEQFRREHDLLYKANLEKEDLESDLNDAFQNLRSPLAPKDSLLSPTFPVLSRMFEHTPRQRDEYTMSYAGRRLTMLTLLEISRLEKDLTWKKAYEKQVQEFEADQEIEFGNTIESLKEENFGSPLTQALLKYQQSGDVEDYNDYRKKLDLAAQRSWGRGRFPYDTGVSITKIGKDAEVEAVRRHTATDNLIQELAYVERIANELNEIPRAFSPRNDSLRLGMTQTARNQHLSDFFTAQATILRVELFQMIEFLKDPFEIPISEEEEKELESLFDQGFTLNLPTASLKASGS